MATILVIDDEPAIRDVLAELLRHEGYRVVAASNGARALELVEPERPDVALVDIMMPVLDGHEFVRRLREVPGRGHIPVIMLSAGSRPRPERYSVAAFLPKPFDLEEILTTVRRILAGEGR